VVALVLKLPHDDAAAPRRRAPVDAARIVARQVVTQRVELHAVAAARRRLDAERGEHTLGVERRRMEQPGGVWIDAQHIAGAAAVAPAQQAERRAHQRDDLAERTVATLARTESCTCIARCRPRPTAPERTAAPRRRRADRRSART
jgi:hypothetical protein